MHILFKLLQQEALKGTVLCMLALSALALLIGASQTEAYGYKEVSHWGSFGILDASKFSHPQFASVDLFGNVYVTDYGNKRVQKFTHDGQFVLEWGSSGRAAGQFDYPTGIAAGDGFVYVADKAHNRIQKFDLAGNFVSMWGSRGSADGELFSPEGIAFHNGTIYVVDAGNHRVQMFSPNGTLVGSFGSSGVAPGQFLFPAGIDVTADGMAFVSDRGNRAIEVFDADGVHIKRLASSSAHHVVVPAGVALDDEGGFYVSDSTSGGVMHYDMSVQDLNRASSKRVIPSDSGSSAAMAIGKHSELYVVDSLNHSIYAYATPQYTAPPPAAEPQKPERGRMVLERDTVPPLLALPDDITVQATDQYTPVDIGRANAIDAGGSHVILNNAPDAYPVGVTRVAWVAIDESGNKSTDYQMITVLACGEPKSFYNIVAGTGDSDMLYGTAGADLIFGSAGDDYIYGGSGTDCIFGGSGDDIILAGTDSDMLYGNGGSDIMRGGSGDDLISGDAGIDILDGGPGADACYEQQGGDDLLVHCEF